MYNYYELSHVIKKYLNDEVTVGDGRASTPVGPSVAMPLFILLRYLMCNGTTK